MNNTSGSSLTQEQRELIAKRRAEALKRQAERRKENEVGPSPNKISAPFTNRPSNATTSYVPPTAKPTSFQSSGFSRSPLKDFESHEFIKPSISFTLQMISPQRFKVIFNAYV